jgi:hypothetical protein
MTRECPFLKLVLLRFSLAQALTLYLEIFDSLEHIAEGCVQGLTESGL